MKILLIFRNYLFRIADSVFGRTSLFIILLGWFLIITGALFLSNPEHARKKIVGMGYGQVKGWLFFFLLCAAGFMVSLALQHAGVLGSGLAIFGCGLLVYLYLRVRKAAFMTLTSWLAKVSLRSIIHFAYFQIVVGVLMLYLRRRFFW